MLKLSGQQSFRCMTSSLNNLNNHHCSIVLVSSFWKPQNTENAKSYKGDKPSKQRDILAPKFQLRNFLKARA